VHLGGITIPERHRDKGDEPTRLANKVEKGASFFTSQIVYSVDNVIGTKSKTFSKIQISINHFLALLRDYSEYTKANNVTPARLIFTFAPFGR
jgi:5,10-methylenetetrahydrofolate reductase